MHRLLASVALSASLACYAMAGNAQAPGPAELDYAALVGDSLQQMDAVELDAAWFFTLNVVRDGELRVINSLPTNAVDARRVLISVGGEAPSAEQLAEFREQEDKRLADEKAQGDSNKYSVLVDTGSLALLGVDGDLAQLSFSPNIEAFADDRKHLQGRLTLNTATGLIQDIAINNTAKLSPAFSVSVKTYAMELSFAVQQGALLLSSLKSTVIGTLGFVKDIDINVEIEFSDYQRLPGQ